jgi:hypothetical protein
MLSRRVIVGVVSVCLLGLASCGGQERGGQDLGEAQFSSSSGNHDKWNFAVGNWNGESLHVSVFGMGEKDIRPLVMTVARQKGGPANSASTSQQNDNLTLKVPIGNSESAIYRVKAGDPDFRPEILKEKYDLDKGSLFVIDFSATPPKVTQVKVDLGKVFPKGRKFEQGDGPPALKHLRAEVPAVEKLLKQIEGK